MSGVKQVNANELTSQFDSFLFDADGVLWLADTPLPGARDLLQYLITAGKNVFITTNNATKTLEDYVKKCKRIGFDMVPDDHIISPGKVLANMLAKENSNLPVYIAGSTALQKELKNEGVESFGTGPDPIESYTDCGFIHDIDISKRVRAVVASYDIHMSYAKVMRAANYIKQPGVRFYATNEDATVPGPKSGVIVPGSGVNVKAVKTAAGKDPIVIGKPGKAMFEYIRDKFNIEAERTVIFGDRCETDIKFGHTNGLKSVLVGTGVHDIEKVKEFERDGCKDLIPDYYIPSLKVLFDMLKK
ncbi:unnamed protein product [Thelazia callipaeda]|uniref:4-nitrophenylphosphatase n=1 Tax=Thelazia callipaeda TaxID=103827 RepID=A0A0N5D522_THECL|nr:unnamed protein product [Thelazia callipaeda]